MMRQRDMILGAACLCLLAAFSAAGCAKKTTVTTTATEATDSSAASTPTVLAPVVVPPPPESTGPITTPEAGSETRTALMDAARKKLGTTSQFVVYQLFVQGDYALGDLETTQGGTRQFVAFRGPEWEALWVAPFGSASASSASAKGEVSGLSAALLAKIGWKYVKPPSSAAMVASLSAASKKWTKTLMDGLGEPYAVTLVKVAKDSKGVWWGRTVVQPSSSASNSYESIEFWCKYTGGAWTGKAQDPEPPAPTTYFPSSVVGALGL
jgi:hypothetical protein